MTLDVKRLKISKVSIFIIKSFLDKVFYKIVKLTIQYID